MENIHSGRDERQISPLKEILKKRRKGNSTALKERPAGDGRGAIDSSQFITLNPKVSYAELKRRFQSPSPMASSINNTSFQNKVTHRSFLSPTPSLKDLKDHIGAFQTIKKELN